MSFSIPRFRKLYSRVQSSLLNYSERVLEYYLIPDLTSDINSKLFDRNREVENNRVRFISQVLSTYEGETLNPDTVDKISIIIAGCEKEMEEGITYRQWNTVDPPTWAAIYIFSVEPLKHKRLYRCILDSYMGMSAGKRFCTALPDGLLKHIIKSSGGRKYEKYEGTDAGGLWFTAVMGVKKNRLRFEEIHASSSQEKHNKRILKGREKCIHGLFRNCINCYLGRDKCYLSRHAETYSLGICRNKLNDKQHKGYIVDNGYCLHCLQNNLINKE